MSSTYAINVTSKKEFEVETELKEIGVTVWLPKMLASKYIKDRGEYEWYDRPYISKLLFAEFPDVYFPDVVKVKHVIGKPILLSERDIRGVPAHTSKATGKKIKSVPGLNTFRDAVDSEYKDRKRVRSNSEYQCEFKPGQALEVLRGALAGFSVGFQSVVKTAERGYPRIKVAVPLLGGSREAEIDPANVVPA